ncbi:MAG: glycoside hydrolase family 2 protein [Bacteroidales bacterium]|nr:glycoside hydrolase family 2 protein [Bacteroidales bacterium]
MKRIALFLLILVALASCTNRQYVFEQYLDRGWTLTSDTLAPMRNFAVPSVVQQTLSDAGVIPYPYSGTVEKDLLWISNHPWTYTTQFNVKGSMLNQEVVELVFEGIDTYASVTLNGEKLFDADNMFRTWKVDVKPLLKEKKNQLVVTFPPYDSVQQALYDQCRPRFPEKYAVTRKAPYQHGWDWAPKYKNIGLWKPVKLVAWSDARLENAYIVTNEISETQAKLTLHLDVESSANGELVVEIRNDGKLIQSCPFQMDQGNQHKMFGFTVENPRLWWPNEIGEQPLYDFEIVLKDNDRLLDSKTIRTGIKTFQMVQEPDANGFSFYFKVNGVPFYAKGANYVPEEMIETWIDDGRTVNLLQESKKAHFNMLRVWGGGIYPSEDFFNSCDSLGILVWEDFMYAGTMYPYDEAFLENAKIEALEQVKRLASHPSLALWCGGNEISEGYYNWGWQQSLGWSAEDDQAMKMGYDRLFETILPMVVDTYDGTRPYWPNSPSKGWGRPESLTQGDVHYWGVWWGEQPYEMYREKVGRFNSEYGYQSYPDIQTLKTAAGDDPEFKALCDYEGDDLYALISKNAFLAAHQKHARGARQINDFIERYFPKAKTFEEYVYLSQLSQAYGMEIAIEAHRTAKPYNMGTLYWQLNDAWPVTSWSSIDHSGRPKAMQYKLRTLYAPVLLSFDQSDQQVYVTSDLMRGIDGMMTVSVNDFQGDRLFEQKVKVDMGANQNRKFYVEGLRECLQKVDPKSVYVKLELSESEKPMAERFCYLVYPKLLQLPKAKLDLSIQQEGDMIQIDVKTDVFAKDVQVFSTSRYGVFSDNFFDLEAGQTRRITFKSFVQEEKIDFSARSL